MAICWQIPVREFAVARMLLASSRSLMSPLSMHRPPITLYVAGAQSGAKQLLVLQRSVKLVFDVSVYKKILQVLATSIYETVDPA